MQENPDSVGVGDRMGCGAACLTVLPEDCISAVIAFTGPKDACRLSAVSKVFRSAAQSDAVWEKFLPSEYRSVIPQSMSCLSKKELYLSLCDNPVLIEDGKKSLSLEKCSGKKCYMLSARSLLIIWGDTPAYWQWTSLPEARFAEVAQLLNVCWFEIRGRISTLMLSPETPYVAYLVFKQTDRAFGFEVQPVDAEVGVVGSEPSKTTVFLATGRDLSMGRQAVHSYHMLFLRRASRWLRPESSEHDGDQYPKERADGWLEVKLGEFFNRGDEEEELQMSVLEIKGGNWKGGLIVQGIEIRPKS